MIVLTYNDLITISEALALADNNELEREEYYRLWKRIYALVNEAKKYGPDQLFMITVFG